MTINKHYSRYLPFIIALLSVFAAFYYNELNTKALKAEAPRKLEPKYEWVRTADDASYIRPAENYYRTGIWKDNNPGRQSYFLRTPGYGLFRYSLMKIMGFEASYYYFRYVQLLLFGLSVFLLFQIALLAGLFYRYALIISCIYGLSPFASGFLYYSLTEGITPACMIFYTYFLLAGYKKNRPVNFIMASLILAYIGVTRPVLLVFGVSLPVAIFLSALQLGMGRKIAFILLTGIIALSPITLWALRSACIANQYVGIYPIYYAENNSQYRPTHEAIWEFEKSYGTEGRDFHELLVPLWSATIKGDTDDIHIDSIMMACPGFVKQTIGESRLRNSYKLYRQSISYQRSHYPDKIAMPDTIPDIEKRVIKDFQTYTLEINSKHWLWCHIAVPIRLFKSLSFHSNLSLYMFQHTYRGRWWMEAMRFAFLLLHFCCCLAFIALLIFSKDPLIKLFWGLSMGAYLFYLCDIFRGLEERYTLPLLPLMILGLGLSISQILKKWKVA